MKGILKLFPAALAVVALASCSNDDLLDKNGSQAVNGKTMEATIEDFTVMTRAAFAENKDDDGKLTARALVWNAGDSYKVYGELATPDKYTLQNAYDGKKTGTFDLMTDDYNTEPAFAVFPYDKVEADRASKKLTVSLTDWTYATSEVKEDGYNQGGFVSNVPMYGICDEKGDAAFGYMTSILRVDLSALPKKMTRLIVVTDRPLTGTFETEFDPSSTTYPEIASPVTNSETPETYTFGSTTYTNNYFLEVGTESVSKRTNKTFFIAVPTGNKYKVFDLLIEYNMGTDKKYELVGQLGNTYRSGAGKSILNWQRGKIKSLTKEITVTASGNTPKAISQFLKDEWQSFPADAEINITVPEVGGNKYIDLSTAADNTFTIPAELKNRVVNIIVEDGVTEGYSAASTMTIVDEDPAPVASKAQRVINFCIPTANKPVISINAPESQIVFSAPSETATALYGNITATVAEGDMTTESAGLTIGENVTVSGSAYIKLDDGSFLSEGQINNIANNGNYEVLIKGDANVINSNANGAVTVKGKLDDNGAIVTKIGTVTAKGSGAVTIDKVQDVNIADGGADATGAITITNVDKVTALTVSNKKHNAPVNITKVTTGGVVDFSYAGLAAVTIDDVIGGSSTQITCTNDKATGDLKVTNLGTAKDATTGATLALINYVGTGNVTVSGVKNNKDVYPTVTSTTISTSSVHKASNVSFTDVTIGTTGLDKQSTGTLTINGVRAAFGAIKNYQGNVSITGNNVKNANIASLTQEKSGDITLKSISKSLTSAGVIDNPGAITSLVFSAADGGNTVNYEDTFIDAITNSNPTAKPAVTFNGTKSSGIGTITGSGTNTFTTDTWDGTSFATKASAGVYTSAQLAGLMVNTSSTAITLNVSNSEIDLGSNAFQIQYGSGAANLKKGIAKEIVSLAGGQYTTSTGAKIPFVIKNLKAESGLFASSATSARSADLSVEYVTLDAPVITATQDAGALVGIANGANHTFTAVKVNNATIASASTGKGTDINLGGFIGQVNATGKDIILKGCNVTTASIKGHYYMGGFIGQVVAATNVKIHDIYGAKADEKGSTVSGITFTPLSADNAWSTLKCGTIAPFIGGIKTIATELNIYGKFDSFDREANKWKLNFLSNESYKFIGTKEDACNFIGYIDVSTTPAFKYYLKNLNGFEADTSTGMKIVTTSDAGKPLSEILATECNAYAEY